MAQQPGAHSRILDRDHVRAAQNLGRAWGQVSKVADRPCDDVKPGLQPRKFSFHKDAR